MLRSNLATGDISLPFHGEPMDTHERLLPGRLREKRALHLNSSFSLILSAPILSVFLSPSRSPLPRQTVSYAREASPSILFSSV